jgi:trans-2,3-dihydro-3-hydroxyanthranilate isomerase
LDLIATKSLTRAFPLNPVFFYTLRLSSIATMAQQPASSTAVTPLDVAVLDVFTREALQGNALAVVPNASALSDAQMQALARETNLSETTFVFPRPEEIEAVEGIKVRIFTVAEELPFAGHPTLGTAAFLYEARQRRHATIVLDLLCGKVPVTFTPQADGSAFGQMTQREPVFGPELPGASFTQGTGCIVRLDPALPVQTVSTGIPFCIVPVASRADLDALSFNHAQAAMFLSEVGAKFAYFITKDSGAQAESAGSVASHHFIARMIFYNGEDPATGSAAGCATSYLVRNGALPPNAPAVISQGSHMARPSLIHVMADRAEDGRVHNVRVGGYTRHVMRGQYFL